MTAPLALQLASRMHAMLLLQLNHSIEPTRMLADPLYARDVLLVCDAHRGSELASLSQQFRLAVAQAAAAQRLAGRSAKAAHNVAATPRPAPPAAAQRGHRDSGAGELDPDSGDFGTDTGDERDTRPPGRSGRGSRNGGGFSASRLLHSLFGPAAPIDRAPARSARPQRGWFGNWRDSGK